MLKASPGKYNYATAGVGSGAHVSMEKFNVAAGVKAVHVPLKGTPPILAETMAGRVEYAMVPAVSGNGPGARRQSEAARREHAEARRGAARRADSRRGRPPEGESIFWLALLAPAKTPRDIVAKINAEVKRALQSAEMKERWRSLAPSRCR